MRAAEQNLCPVNSGITERTPSCSWGADRVTQRVTSQSECNVTKGVPWRLYIRSAPAASRLRPLPPFPAFVSTLDIIPNHRKVSILLLGNQLTVLLMLRSSLLDQRMEVTAPGHSQEDVATRNPPTLQTGFHFPLDLVDSIMKERLNRRMSLSNCLLVCRDWARLAYMYHFENFCYSPQGWDNSKYIHGTLSPLKLEPRDLVNFFVFLRTSPTVCGCIRELRLNGRITQEYRYVLDVNIFGVGQILCISRPSRFG